MKKGRLLLMLICEFFIAMITGTIMSINQYIFQDFIKQSIITGIIFFILFIIITTVIIKFKNKKKEASIILSIIAITCILIIITISSISTCLTAVTPPHFRTNIITGKCNFGGADPCVAYDPWYYKSGCNLSQEELVKILEEENRLKFIKGECEADCQFGHTGSYCSDKGISIWGPQKESNGIKCDHIINCENITCK